MFPVFINIAPIDSAQNARSVREDTADLADYFLSDGSAQRRRALLQRPPRSSVHDLFSPDGDNESIDDNVRSSETIPEVSEPASPDDQADQKPIDAQDDDGPSMLANLLKRSPPQSGVTTSFDTTKRRPSIPKPESPQLNQTQTEDEDEQAIATENSPLLPGSSNRRRVSDTADLEGQAKGNKRWIHKLMDKGHRLESNVTHAFAVAVNPSRWDGKAIWQNAVADPISCLPAVAVGLLLNILDALSYGKWSRTLPGLFFIFF